MIKNALIIFLGVAGFIFTLSLFDIEIPILEYVLLLGFYSVGIIKYIDEKSKTNSSWNYLKSVKYSFGLVLLVSFLLDIYLYVHHAFLFPNWLNDSRELVLDNLRTSGATEEEILAKDEYIRQNYNLVTIPIGSFVVYSLLGLISTLIISFFKRKPQETI